MPQSEIFPLHRGAARPTKADYYTSNASARHPEGFSPAPPVSFADEEPEPLHWPSFLSGIVLGVAGGLLAVAVPAIIIARVAFGAWL